MRAIAILLSAVVAVGCNSQDAAPVVPPAGDEHGHGHHHGHDHGPHARRTHGGGGHHEHETIRTTLDVRAEGEVEAGEPAVVRMSITGKDGKPVKEFQKSHEAKVHLIIVRDGLDHFAHLHPEVNDGSGELTVRHTFPVGGNYHLFADYREGNAAGLAVGTLAVAGEAPAAPPLTPDVPGTITGDGLSAEVSVEGGTAGGETTIEFLLTTSDGTPATDLEPYMGARGHLNAVSADRTRFVHLHPVGDGREGHRVAFAGSFAAPGLYKGWGQFKRNGEVQVVPFALQME